MSVVTVRPTNPDTTLVNDPLAYGKLYQRPMIAIAYEHAISTNVLYQYESGKKRPSAQTKRVSQLLDFIRRNGLEPPEPLWD